jgi:hypothetical protein
VTVVREESVVREASGATAALAEGVRGDRLHRMVARAFEDVGDLEAAGVPVRARAARQL